MIIRGVSTFDVADDEALVTRLKYFYDVIDSSVKPIKGLFSWVPGLSMAQKVWASMSVYRVFNKAVQDRKSSGIKRNDTLQQLLDAGESLQCTLGVRSPLTQSYFSIYMLTGCLVDDGITYCWRAFYWYYRYVDNIRTPYDI